MHASTPCNRTLVVSIDEPISHRRRTFRRGNSLSLIVWLLDNVMCLFNASRTQTMKLSSSSLDEKWMQSWNGFSRQKPARRKNPSRLRSLSQLLISNEKNFVDFQEHFKTNNLQLCGESETTADYRANWRMEEKARETRISTKMCHQSTESESRMQFFRIEP